MPRKSKKAGGGSQTEEERLLLQQRRAQTEEEATRQREQMLTLFLKVHHQKILVSLHANIMLRSVQTLLQETAARLSFVLRTSSRRTRGTPR